MAATLSIQPSAYMNPMSHHHRKRVQLKRATQQINDPAVQQELKNIKTKKSVRFHQQLEHIRYFYKSHSSASVKNDPPFMDVSAEDYKLALPDWPSRNNILYNVNENKVRMESAQLMDGDFNQMSNNKMVIEGRCRAMNLSFQKVVTIRYTFNLWRTYQETTAVYCESIPSTSNTWDRFSFSIPVEIKNSTQTIYLALKYTVDNHDYWDNNNGTNYEMNVIRETPVEEESNMRYEQTQSILTPTPTPLVSIEKQYEEELALNISKKENKVLGKRYDFTASLSAARKPFSPSSSPPGTPVDTENLSYTPSVFFGNSFDQPITYTVPIAIQQKKEPVISEPVPISAPPISEGFQMSYSDFVNRYCFYSSHTNPIHGIYSTSPSAVLS